MCDCRKPRKHRCPEGERLYLAFRRAYSEDVEAQGMSEIARREARSHLRRTRAAWMAHRHGTHREVTS